MTTASTFRVNCKLQCLESLRGICWPSLFCEGASNSPCLAQPDPRRQARIYCYLLCCWPFGLCCVVESVVRKPRKPCVRSRLTHVLHNFSLRLLSLEILGPLTKKHLRWPVPPSLPRSCFWWRARPCPRFCAWPFGLGHPLYPSVWCRGLCGAPGHGGGDVSKVSFGRKPARRPPHVTISRQAWASKLARCPLETVPHWPGTVSPLLWPSPTCKAGCVGVGWCACGLPSCLSGRGCSWPDQ